MSELKTYKMVDEKYCTDCVCVIPFEVYLKSEADKVIAELKEQVHDYGQGLYVIQAKAEMETRHHKYKRCLAMARWCSTEYGTLVSTWEFKIKHYKKWHKRWLELAEKFKEAK